jgi:hypothetical protein
MREIIKNWLKKLEVMTGLKQFRVPDPVPKGYNEELTALIDSLEAKINEYHWMTEHRLNEIMKRGMEGEFVYVDPKGVRYGEFYSINVKTITQWCNTYYEHHKQHILIENFPKDKDPEPSKEEIAYWTKIGNDNFRMRFEESKNGYIAPLAEWGPYFYTNLMKKGLLTEENYQVDEKAINAELRLTGQLRDVMSFTTKKRERVWRMFIKDMIYKKINLPDLL